MEDNSSNSGGWRYWQTRWGSKGKAEIVKEERYGRGREVERGEERGEEGKARHLIEVSGSRRRLKGLSDTRGKLLNSNVSLRSFSGV